MRTSRGALAAAAILVITAPAIHAQSTADIARVATPATVTIVTLDAFEDTLGLGSGFVVQPDGVIVTNYHVMRGAFGASIRFPSGAEFTQVEALAADPERDLAILKVSGLGMRSLDISTSAPVVGDKLVVIGAPRGLDFTVSEGIVSAVRRSRGQEWIQMSAPISPGSSGGPVLNASGKVVGVTTAYREDGQALNFAVPIRYATTLMANADDPASLAATFSGSASSKSGTQSITLTGEVTNMGSIIQRARPRTGDFSLTTGEASKDSVRLTIGEPLGGSGSARVFCWNDSLMMLSMSAQGDTIAWLGESNQRRVSGEYVIVGGEYARQGGTWWLSMGSHEPELLSRACNGRPSERATAGAVKLTTVFRQQGDPLAIMASMSDSEDRTQPTAAERAEMQAAQAELGRRVAEDIEAVGLMPRILEYLQANGISDAAEARAEGQRLGIDGVFRLEPEEHYNRLRVWGELLANLDAATCNRWAELDASQRGMYLISRMSDEQLRRHAAWQVRAAQAELEAERPSLRLSHEAVVASIARIADNLDDEEGQRLRTSLAAYETATAAERCWVERAIIRGALAERGKRRYQLATAYWMLATGSTGGSADGSADEADADG